MMTLTTCKTPPLACVFKLTLAEELDEAALAVGFVVLLFECALVQLFKAEGADEMLGVELLAHGGDAAAGDGFLTAGAEGAAVLVVMSLTVGLPFMLEETAVHKRNETLLRENTGVSQLRMNDANNATIKPDTAYMQQKHLRLKSVSIQNMQQTPHVLLNQYQYLESSMADD